MPHPKVFIVILNWNGLPDTLECLESVSKLDYPNFDVVVIDNGSAQDPTPIIRQQYPRVALIRNASNLGYTGGNNMALAHALERGADYVWLLNNDATVEATCLTRLVATAEQSHAVGLVSPVIYHHGDRTRRQFSGSRIDRSDLSLTLPDLSGPAEAGFLAGPDVCLWGTALLVKAALVRRIGALREEYFAYWEDTEYSLRALAAGYENQVCPSAAVYHKAVPPETVRPSPHFHYYMTRNRILLARQYLTWRERIRFYRHQVANLGITMKSYRDLGVPEAAEARLRGFIDGLRFVTGPMPLVNARASTRILSALLLSHPYALALLLEGRLGGLWRLLVSRSGLQH